MEYDPENDILTLHKGFSSGERFASNVAAGDIILDVSTRDRVRGIEILNATDILRPFGVELREVLDLDFDAQTKPSAIYLKMLFKTATKEIPAMIAVART